MSPSISGVLLAAGSSRRFGGDLPKQLQNFEGEPLVRRAARQALASSLGEVIVVVGAAAEAVRSALEDLPVSIVENTAYEAGQSTSVQAGLEAVATTADAVLFLPCDQPFLDAETLNWVIWAYEKTGGGIVVPAFEGKRGAPTLFDRRYFPELLSLSGDVGGRVLLERYADRVLTVALESELPLLDADTPSQLERLRRRAENPVEESPRTVIDHLVYGVPNLKAGVEEWQKLTGIEPTAGGRHPSWGTANALLSLGQETYLEIIGPDPELDLNLDKGSTPGPRLFGLNTLTSGSLRGWAAAVSDLDERVRESRRRGYDSGPSEAKSRRRPDGTELKWKMALPADLQLRAGGCLPFLVDWQGAQTPAARAASGCRLLSLTGEHPEPEKVRRSLAALGLRLPVKEGSGAGVRALLETPAGRLILDRRGAWPVVV